MLSEKITSPQSPKIKNLKKFGKSRLGNVGITMFCLLFCCHCTAQTKKQTKQEKLKQKHDTWISAKIIAAGDTVSVRIRPNKYIVYRYSGRLGKDAFYTSKFTAAFDNETERVIEAQDYAELLLPDSTGRMIKYVCIKSNDEDGHIGYAVYALLQDGYCQVLYQPHGGILFRGGGMLMWYESVGWSKTQTTNYCLYYKNTLWPVAIKTREIEPYKDLYSVTITEEFRKKLCADIFADCPRLIDVIQKRALIDDGLFHIVDEFNNCMLIGTPSKK